MAEILQHFEPDAAKLQVLAACIDDYGIAASEGIGDEAEWPNNMISRHAVVYGNGQIARRGQPTAFATDAGELALCERLSEEAKSIAGDMAVGMGSESGDIFHAFFIAASESDAKPERIDSIVIRTRFSHTIFPTAVVSFEPFVEGGKWWGEVSRDGESEDDAHLETWRALIEWFGGREEFVDVAFVRVGGPEMELLEEKRRPPGTAMTPSAFPRMLLGLTRGGSLCGLFGWVVQT